MDTSKTVGRNAWAGAVVRRRSRAWRPALHNPGLNLIAADRDHAQLILGTVVVDRKPAVVGEALERRPLIGQIAHGLAEWRLGQHGPREPLAHGRDLRE